MIGGKIKCSEVGGSEAEKSEVECCDMERRVRRKGMRRRRVIPLKIVTGW